MATHIIEFQHQRIDENHVMVQFKDGASKLMTVDEFTEFLGMAKKLQLTVEGSIDIKEFLGGYVKVFNDAWKSGTSMVGEHVNIEVVRDVKTPKGAGYTEEVEYVIVGDSGTKYKMEITTFELSGMNPKIDPAELHRCLVGLAWNGAHATKAEIRRYFEILGRDIPETWRD